MPLRPRDPAIASQPPGRHATVTAALSPGDIVDAYYDGVLGDDYWSWWVREMRLNPLELIVDDGDGDLYRVPFTIDDNDNVTFGAPTEVEMVYVDVPPGSDEANDHDAGPFGGPITVAASAPTQVLAARWEAPQATRGQAWAAALHAPMTGSHAHQHSAMGSQGGDASHSHEHTHNNDANHDHHGAQAAAGSVSVPLRRPPDEPTLSAAANATTDSNEPHPQPDGGQLVTPEQLAALGLAPDATHDEINAALNARLGIGQEPTVEPTPETAPATAPVAVTPEPELVAAGAPPVPEGFRLIDEATLAQLSAGAQAGLTMQQQAQAADRANRVDRAIREGRIAAASRNDWLGRLAGPDAAAMASYLESAPPLLPVREVGYSGGDITEQAAPTTYPRSWAPKANASVGRQGRITVGGD